MCTKGEALERNKNRKKIKKEIKIIKKELKKRNAGAEEYNEWRENCNNEQQHLSRRRNL